MAKINVTQGTAGAYGAGELQLQNKAQMDATLRIVTDNLNTASPLKLSTALVQSTSTVKITTSDVAYIDAEDNSGNNRFTVSRAVASQLVTVDFASVPTALTTPVGAIRTATDGVNLANVTTFLENGNIGMGTDTPTNKLHVLSSGFDVAKFDSTFGQMAISFANSGTTFAQLGSGVSVSATGGATDLGLGTAGSASTNILFATGAGFVERMRITSAGNVGIGTAAPTTTLDVEGTSFLRGNVNAGKTANINVTTAVNGTGGGNREFTTFTGASATGFTGTDASDQGYGYFACTIVSGRSYEMSTTIVVTNGAPLTFITSTGTNFATDTVQTVTGVPVSNTVYRFVASGNASFFGVSASNSGGGMTCVVSNFSIKEVGSVLVAYDSNVGIGTTAPAVPLDVIGNIRSSTGILFGTDTAAANALDDYEEGTWTATFVGQSTAGTYTPANVNATYTKIGRVVTLQYKADFSTSASGGAGYMEIAGLPFTYANNSGGVTGSIILSNASWGGSYLALLPTTSSSDSKLLIVETAPSTALVNFVQAGDFNASTDIRFTLTYQV